MNPWPVRLPGAEGDLDSPPKIRILIADNHPIFRDGLHGVLEKQSDFIIVGEAVDGAEALRLASTLKPDILLLDLAMREPSGIEVLEEIGRAGLEVKTVLLAAGINATEKIKSLQLGARGIALKETPTPLVLTCIRTVAAGGYWVGPEIVSDLVQAIAQLKTADRGPTPRKWSLTPRETEILSLLVTGHGNKGIAQKCGITEDTVKHHLTNIFDKTGVSNRLELVLFAIHHQFGAT